MYMLVLDSNTKGDPQHFLIASETEVIFQYLHLRTASFSAIAKNLKDFFFIFQC